MAQLLEVFLLLSCLHTLTETNSAHSPRMIFTDKAVKRLPPPGHHAVIQVLLGGRPDVVTAVGQTHLIFYNLQNPKTPVQKKVVWDGCTNNDCNYNITVVHQRENASQVFVCGTNGREMECCDVNLAEQSPMCIPSEKMKSIRESIKEFSIKEGEQSGLVESELSADLYITHSGSQEYAGIHKFGRRRVRPAKHDKEQYYVGLVLSRRRDDPLQDRVYAFYRQKNKDTELDSEMWLPFVSQVCMADVGGRKNNLQFSWTSQMNARLFCGDPDSKQLFSELVDVAAVYADRWQDTKIYALFRNEWGMSAVCVYTIQDIDYIFANSVFKDVPPDNSMDRPRACVSDSTEFSMETLRTIEKISEMEDWVMPADRSGLLLFNHHNYTHMYVDSSQHKRNSQHIVMFLSLNNGGIHKVMQNKSHAVVIAEYQPFDHRAHLRSISLQPSSGKLYVNSRSELAQIDVANCDHYGNTCEECILSRDPYCGWNSTHCIPETDTTVQDVSGGDYGICESSKLQFSGKVDRYSSNGPYTGENVVSAILPPRSKYFLRCPVSSRHAQYTWRHHGRSTNCSTREEQCLVLIDSMSPKEEGKYTCESEEMGYKKVLVRYHLQLKGRAAGLRSTPVVWFCLMVVLIKSLFC